MLKGRLGLDTARLPHADRHGLLWRRTVAERLRRDAVIPTMIDRIKDLFSEEKADADDGGGHP